MTAINNEAPYGAENEQVPESRFVTEVYEHQFKDKMVRFKLIASCVMISVEDLIEAAAQQHHKGKAAIDILADYLNTSMYSKREIDFETNDSGELEIWMSGLCVRDFVKNLSGELSEWFNPIFKDLEKEHKRIGTALNKHTRSWYFKELLMPRHEDYIYRKEDSADGLVQTFYHDDHPISLCATESEVLVCANSIVDLQKEDCSEWFDLKSTQELFDACFAKNQTALCVHNEDRTRRRISAVWINIALAEDLAQWLTKKATLRIWLQNRAAELRFFNDTTVGEHYMKALNDDHYITTNCVMSRT